MLWSYSRHPVPVTWSLGAAMSLYPGLAAIVLLVPAVCLGLLALLRQRHPAFRAVSAPFTLAVLVELVYVLATEAGLQTISGVLRPLIQSFASWRLGGPLLVIMGLVTIVGLLATPQAVEAMSRLEAALRRGGRDGNPHS